MKLTTDNYQLSMAKAFRSKSHVTIVLTAGGVQYSFKDEDIISAKKTDDVDPLARRLPVHTFEFSINDFSGQYDPSNPQGIWEQLDENSMISVVFGLEDQGTTQWLAPDDYYLEGKPTVQGNVATFKAVSILTRLSTPFYKITPGSKTYYELAEAILTESGITNYYLSDILRTYTTNAPLPIDTGANLLQMIAHATSCVLHANRGKITIEPLETADITYDDNPITLKDVALDGDKVSKIEPLYKVQANKYTYTPDSTATVLINTQIYVNNTTIYHFDYEAADDITVSTTFPTSVRNIYTRAADFKINGGGLCTFQISGKILRQSVDMAETTASLDPNNSVDVEDNPILTSDVLRNKLLLRTKNYLLLRLTHEISFRGSPEIEALDGVILQSEYGYSNNLILNTTTNYDGTISGKIIAKAIGSTGSVNLYDENNQQVYDHNGQAIKLLGVSDYTSEFTYQEMNEFCQDVLGG